MILHNIYSIETSKGEKKMSNQSKRWTCPYCHTTKTSILKPPTNGCPGRKDKNGKYGFHKWERTG